MPLRRLSTAILLGALLWFCTIQRAEAAEYHGIVTFGGLPVPGAVITAKRGDKSFTTISGQGGLYHFDDLADGKWTITIAMQCFRTVQAQVTIAPSTPAGKWELTLLPIEQLLASTKVEQNPILAQPVPEPGKTATGNTAAEMPKPPEEASEDSADGLLVQGSENNAATSRYSTNAAFGNTRTGTSSLYTGGLATILDNSATDARPYSISGLTAPKSTYTLITSSAYFGGQLKIPRVLPHGPNFFVNYEWTRDNNAAINTGLVPTVLERSGNLAGLVNAQGQPVTVYDPATGIAYFNNQVPVSPQAAALLALYPAPNPNIPATSGYNYQAPVLNRVHQDSMQSRMDKTLGHRNELYGGFNFQSTRAANVSLFDFVDSTGSLGMNANLHWIHWINSHLFVSSGFTFSRMRTEVAPNFANRSDISGPNDANISGNDQDPADWGPPALNFSSGIAALTDGNSAFNRSRTDAVSLSADIFRGRHNVTIGGDFRKQEYNDDFSSRTRAAPSPLPARPRPMLPASATTGSDLADFLIGIPDTSAIAYGNADKYLREAVYDAYVTDDWRIFPAHHQRGHEVGVRRAHDGIARPARQSRPQLRIHSRCSGSGHRSSRAAHGNHLPSFAHPP